MARGKHLNVWIPYTFPSVRGNCSKPKIGAFTGALRLRELVHMLFLPIIRRAGGKPSSRPALLCSIGLWSRPQPSMPLTWSASWSLILVGHRSSCFFLYLWFRLLGLSIKTSSSDTMPICAFSPETMLFLGFSSSQSIEQDYVCGPVCICCRGFCSQKRHPPPNLQSLKGMAIVERLLGVTMLSQALTPRRNPHVFRHQGKPLSGSHWCQLSFLLGRDTSLAHDHQL